MLAWATQAGSRIDVATFQLAILLDKTSQLVGHPLQGMWESGVYFTRAAAAQTRKC